MALQIPTASAKTIEPMTSSAGADDAGPNAAGGVSHTGRLHFHWVFAFPGAKFSIAQGVFFSFVIENVKGLRRLA